MRSADMQKVTMLPGMPGCKRAAFTSRVVAFNVIFALTGKPSKVKKIFFYYNCRHTAQSIQYQHPPHRAALYTKGLSIAKLLPHTAHSG